MSIVWQYRRDFNQSVDSWFGVLYTLEFIEHIHGFEALVTLLRRFSVAMKLSCGQHGWQSITQSAPNLYCRLIYIKRQNHVFYQSTITFNLARLDEAES
jgi:hypothetical protein